MGCGIEILLKNIGNFRLPQFFLKRVEIKEQWKWIEFIYIVNLSPLFPI